MITLLQNNFWMLLVKEFLKTYQYLKL